MAKRVFVWGTFDILHDGHKRFLEEAASYGDELYVLVIPDQAVRENKGRDPHHSHETRRMNVEALPYVTKAFVDSLNAGLSSFLDVRPHVLCFGYDQDRRWAERLILFAKQNGLEPKIIWAKAYPHKHTTHIIRSRKRKRGK